MEADDHALVRECLNGNTRAFEKLLERYERPVFNAARRMVASEDEARDVAPTVFLRAYESLATFDFQHKFYSWLYRIAINESYKHLGKTEASRRMEPLAMEPPALTRNPEEEFGEVELAREVQQALMTMKATHRSVIVLRHFQQCSYREIGYILEIPEKTVKSRLFTARQVLRDRLAARGIL
jgi:RNA polymerase sigma-70 factor (ECF subfamily)